MEKTQGDTSVTPITPKSDEHIQAGVNAATLLRSPRSEALPPLHCTGSSIDPRTRGRLLRQRGARQPQHRAGSRAAGRKGGIPDSILTSIFSSELYKLLTPPPYLFPHSRMTPSHFSKKSYFPFMPSINIQTPLGLIAKVLFSSLFLAYKDQHKNLTSPTENISPGMSC